MATRTRLARLTGPFVPLVLLGALAACGPQPAAPANGDTDAGGPVATESSTPDTPSGAPSRTPAAREPAPEPAGPGTVADALLPAEQVPGFNDQFTWREESTQDAEPAELAGPCHLFEMVSIGAEKVAYRTYRSTQGDNSAASELVAEFPDEMTANRAFEVLKSWRGKCGAKLKGFERRDVGALEPVDTEVGEGHWYLLTYGPVEGDPDSAHFDAQGLVKVGNRIAVLRLALIGQDYNYELGQEPMVAGVQAAASRL